MTFVGVYKLSENFLNLIWWFGQSSLIWMHDLTNYCGELFNEPLLLSLCGLRYQLHLNGEWMMLLLETRGISDQASTSLVCKGADF